MVEIVKKKETEREGYFCLFIHILNICIYFLPRSVSFLPLSVSFLSLSVPFSTSFRLLLSLLGLAIFGTMTGKQQRHQFQSQLTCVVISTF